MSSRITILLTRKSAAGESVLDCCAWRVVFCGFWGEVETGAAGSPLVATAEREPGADKRLGDNASPHVTLRLTLEKICFEGWGEFERGLPGRPRLQQLKRSLAEIEG